MNAVKLSSIALVGLGLLVASPAEAGIKKVTVVGEAAAVDGNRDQSEKAAKRAARRKAVEEGAGVLVESNTIVRNFQMVSDEIATSARGVIVDETWGALSIKDGVAKIQLTAKVSPAAIEDAICTVIKANHDPKVAIIMVEKVGKDDQPYPKKAERGLVENVLTRALSDSCFTIVESGVKVTEVAANGDIPQSAINEAIKNSDAQYLLVGRSAVIEAAKPEGGFLGAGMNSFKFSAELRMINTSTNVVDMTTRASIVAAGVSPANAWDNTDNQPRIAKHFSNKLMNDIVTTAAKKWTDELINASKVMVQVEDAKKYSEIKKLQNILKKSGKGVKVTGSPRMRAGRATFTVEIDGGSDALILALEEKKVGKKTVEIIEVGRGKVVVKLAK